MGVQISKSFLGNKTETVIAAISTVGGVSAPAVGEIKIYNYAAPADAYRVGEMIRIFKDTIHEALRENVLDFATGTTYVLTKLDNNKAGISVETVLTNIVEGVAAIGIEASLLKSGSVPLKSCVDQMIDRANELDQLWLPNVA